MSTEKNLKSVFKCGRFNLNLSQKTHIMGILNITLDSFSDGGRFFEPELALEHGLKLVYYGADIIDIGGESTRPGSKSISSKEEIKRVIPVLKKLVKQVKVPISVDTYKYEVAKAALEEGASIINDIYALHHDKRIATLVARKKAGLVLMHMKGSPVNMQINPVYKDLIKEILNYLKDAVKTAVGNGVGLNSIIIDPGIGFGKTVEHNLSIIRNLRELKKLNLPVLIGTSRKSFIGKILDLPVTERLEGTISSVVVSILNGADIVRVHDVKEIFRAVKVVNAIREGSR